MKIKNIGRKIMTAACLAIATTSFQAQAEPGYAGEWERTRLYGHAYDSGDFTDEQYDWIRDHFEYFTIEKTHMRAIYGNPSHELTSRIAAARMVEANPLCKPLMIYSIGGDYPDLFESEAQALIDHPDYFLYNDDGDTISLNLSNPDENDWYIDTVNWNCENSDLHGIFVDGFSGTYLTYPDNVRYMLEGMEGTSFRLLNGIDMAPGGMVIRDYPDLFDISDGVFIDNFFRKRCVSANSAVVLLDALITAPNDYMMVCWGSYDGNTDAYGGWPATHEFTHAAYLIVANDNTYYRWVGEGSNWGADSMMSWDDDFDKEMGEPLDQAVKDGYVYTRVFEHCTVTLDVENKTSSIVWGQNNGTSGPPIGKDIWLKAEINGKYVCADQSINSYAPLYANRAAYGGWERFTVINAGNGYIALKANVNGMYVSADLADANVQLQPRYQATSIGSWEKFTWVENSDGTISLKVRRNGNYVSADSNVDAARPLCGNKTAIGAWEKFTWGEY
ncbi:MULTISPECIES: putative glycoside hydrolase [unclassified Lentimonas]|uniref:putative glycoside hydrolase n=1 Tax=unclassified Lentimonas TaxID=2630993 RepID=UPI0013295C83|nr:MULTISPECIES: putative glycoside hydrolase [unclassified Lentimonas]CAA6679384.1 Unannotated [Lentimonas sp. CC4]CAA6687418.1 Unannotated [Lentimonas sp. CC6]CAA7078000.1 Unannotated [Lentimonas sp. CC4]CAA7172056.1 Unannotated [Lentimonas sp. CC21]CAA7183587.1 Unannotated [Lentimonas sp. CC8]